MKGDAQGILAVATSIADGQDVDWPAIEAGLRSEEERALVRSLRVIASIGELHRSTDPDPDGDPDPLRSPLRRRRPQPRRVGAALSGERHPRPSWTHRRTHRSTWRRGWSGSPRRETQAPGEADATLEPPLAETGEHAPPPSASTRSNPLRTAAATPGPPSGSSGAEPPVPERWGSLVVRERVGAGVFGEVYRAYDEQLQREVALKLLRVGSRSSDRLAAKVLNEGRLLARLRHPNVVLVHGVEARGDRVGLWMEFVRGCTLEQLLDRQGLFGAREAALIGQDLCRALAAVHAAGLVHRDVKAQNVMREEGGRVVLMDFGTGVPAREDDGGRGAPAAGTPLYLAPELLDGGEATASSDLYSLGVLLYHLVTGGYPVVAASLGESEGRASARTAAAARRASRSAGCVRPGDRSRARAEPGRASRQRRRDAGRPDARARHRYALDAADRAGVRPVRARRTRWTLSGDRERRTPRRRPRPSGRPAARAAGSW